jgi:hypothetical protein
MTEQDPKYTEQVEPCRAFLDDMDESEVPGPIVNFLNQAYRNTQEYESGDYSLLDTGVHLNVEAPYLSRLPLVGKMFKARVRIEQLLALCVEFGQLWEIEYPHDRGTVDSPAGYIPERHEPDTSSEGLK